MRSSFFGVVVLCAAALQANVFDDAKAWYRGAYDGNGDGKFANGKGCFRDVLHAANPAHANHGVQIIRGTGGSDILVQTMDVTCPYRNEIIKDEPCLYFANPTEKVGTADVEGKTYDVLKINPSYIGFPALFADYPGAASCSNYTAVLRVRYDTAVQDCSGVHSTLLNLGLSWATGPDVGLCLSLEKDDTTGALNRRMKYSTGNGFQTDSNSWKETNKDVAAPHIPTNRWIDVAVAVNGTEVTVGYTWDDDLSFRENATSGPDTHDNRQVRWWTVTGLTVRTPAFKRGRTLAFGGESTGALVYTNCVDKGSNQRKAFRGALHQFALWHRTLSKEEILEAFGDGRPSVFRVGLAGRSADLFTKTETSVDSWKKWENLNNELTTANPSASIGFTYVRTYDKKLPQILRVKLTDGSAAGKLAVTVNGRPAKNALELSPGRSGLAYVPATCFETGANTLTVTRTDGGTSPLVLETLELFGSWQRGDDTDYHGKLEMVSEQAAGNTMDLGDGSMYHIKRGFLPGNATNKKEIIPFNVPEDLAGQVNATVMLQTGYEKGLTATTPFHITLNGTEIYTHEGLDWYKTYTAKVPKNLLVPGKNELVFECTGGGGWINLSSWRFTYDGVPSGLMVIFR